jgi:hypothetical protein
MLRNYRWQRNVRELRAFRANLSMIAGPRQLPASLVDKAVRAWARIMARGGDR